MRIGGFHIDGFGPFHDTGVDTLPPGLVLFHGDNEAGKSSLLEFFRTLLFGLPKSRWTPAFRGGRHGGRVTLVPDNGDRLLLERYASAASRPVVTLADGSPGDAHALEALLGPSMTPDLYRNVMAFGLDDLQGLDSLTGDAVAGLLHDASIGVPVARLQGTARMLDDMGKRYLKKRNGQARLNDLFAQRSSLQAEYDRAEKTLPHYIDLQAQYAAAEQAAERMGASVEEARAQCELLQRRRDGLEHWTRVCEALADHDAEHFPPDAPERFDRFLRQEQMLQAHKAQRRDERDELARKLSAQVILLSSEDVVAEVRRCVALTERVRDVLRQQDRLAAERERLDHDIAQGMRQLGDPWTEERVAALAGASLPERDRLEHGARVCSEARRGAEEAARRLEEKENACAELRRECEALEERLQEAAPAESLLEHADALREAVVRGRLAVEACPRHESLLADVERRMALCAETFAGGEVPSFRMDETQTTVREWARRLAVQTQEVDAARLRLAGCQETVDECVASGAVVSERLAGLPGPADAVEMQACLRAVREAANRVANRTELGSAGAIPAWMPLVRIFSGTFGLCGAVLLVLAGVGVLASVAWAVLGGIFLLFGCAGLWAMRQESEMFLSAKESDSAQVYAQWHLPEDMSLSTLADACEQKIRLFERQHELDAELDSRQKRLQAQQQTLHDVSKQYDDMHAQWHAYAVSLGAGGGVSPEDVLERIIPAVREWRMMCDEQQRARADYDAVLTVIAQLRSSLNAVCDEALDSSMSPMQVLSLATARLASMREVEARQADVQALQQKYDFITSSLHVAEEASRLATEALREAENVVREADATWCAILRDMGLPESLSVATALQASELLSQTYKAMLQRDDVMRQTQAHAIFLSETLQQVADVASRMNVPHISCPQEASALPMVLDQWAQLLTDGERTRAAIDALKPVITECEEQISALARELDEVTLARESLFREVGVVTDEEFHALTLRWRARCERQQAARESRAMLMQIFGSDDPKVLAEHFSHEDADSLALAHAASRAALEEMEQQYRQMQQEVGSLASRLNAFQNDTAVSTLRQRLAETREAMREEWAQWASYVLANHLLERACAVFERERQPEALREASSFLRDMTAGRYVRITTPVEDRAAFRVEDLHGAFKSVDMLSRGTREQLFLSIRFGHIVASQLQRESLPVILDDIAVNFDPHRRKAAIGAFLSLARSMQVLYFTCHPETVAAFRAVDPNVPVVSIRDGAFVMESVGVG